MSRYLLTGATTPIGEALVRELLRDDGTQVILTVGAEPLRRRAVEVDGRVRYERLDLTRERSLRGLMFGLCRELELEVIVDMASHRTTSAVGARARALNVLTRRRLLELAEAHPTFRRFVYRSYAEVYDVSLSLPSLIDEAHPLDLRPEAPQWVRDRIEADLSVCTQMGMSRLSIAVLRAAECLAPQTGSQLHDYLASRVCFRPIGFDPIVNLISEADLGRALALAARSEATGIFTIPGATTLPLSEVIRRRARTSVSVPGPLMTPLYALRRRVLRTEFDYSINRGRLHFGGVLDGKRAEDKLGYRPEVRVTFPKD